MITSDAGVLKAPNFVSALGLVAVVMVVSVLHYLASTRTILLHEILSRLYYVPIVIAAVRYGAQGGLAISLLSSALYLPHIVLDWHAWPVFEVGQYGEVVLFNVVAAVTGSMADRLRSERNRYQRASEELGRAYEQLVTTTEERLKAERMATVGRMAAGLAHQIRTPLSAILGCFEILGSDYPVAHPKREFVEILKTEIARAEGVVAAFLEFAQPGAVKFEPIDLNDVVRGAGRLVAPSVAERAAKPIALELCSAPISIVADAHQLQRALIELMLAGSALTSHGSVRISTSRNSAAAVRMSVEPVEEGLARDLFEPFGENHARTGLTLPLVKRLVENQGGRITAAHDGKCLQFIIELPTRRITAAVPAIAPAAS